MLTAQLDLLEHLDRKELLDPKEFKESLVLTEQLDPLGLTALVLTEQTEHKAQREQIRRCQAPQELTGRMGSPRRFKR